jgi:hypothetical protein
MPTSVTTQHTIYGLKALKVCCHNTSLTFHLREQQFHFPSVMLIPWFLYHDIAHNESLSFSLVAIIETTGVPV